MPGRARIVGRQGTGQGAGTWPLAADPPPPGSAGMSLGTTGSLAGSRDAPVAGATGASDVLHAVDPGCSTAPGVTCRQAMVSSVGVRSPGRWIARRRSGRGRSVIVDRSDVRVGWKSGRANRAPGTRRPGEDGSGRQRTSVYSGCRSTKRLAKGHLGSTTSPRVRASSKAKRVSLRAIP
ncbi:hypothetical protein SDC9_143937 [bioreactor metagenome]|uniref:Uncharacterized protein n=1 Tax=bioreactor metagenome TaxID=1076179 RepID=A0A645E813_9ZZZZ